MAQRADIRAPCILAEAYERLANLTEEFPSQCPGGLNEDETRGQEMENERGGGYMSFPPTHEQDKAAMSPTSRLLSVSQTDDGVAEDGMDLLSPLETCSAHPLAKVEEARELSHGQSRETWGVKTKTIVTDKNSFAKKPAVVFTIKSRREILEEGEQVSRSSFGENSTLFRWCSYAPYTSASFSE